MTETAEALVYALRSDIDNAELWQVYADWLTSHGDVRGQLVMLELRQQSPGLSTEERLALQQQVDALVAEHQGAWLSGLVVPVGTEFTWRHGFERRDAGDLRSARLGKAGSLGRDVILPPPGESPDRGPTRRRALPRRFADWSVLRSAP